MSEEIEFPKSLEGFGYQFNDKGELRNIKTGERFEFFVKPEDRHYNQRNYEELGEVIGEFIEDELVKSYNLIRKIIPVDSEEHDNIAKSRIYLSDDAQECQTLLLLIQGSGVVRPGQWARQVIINESLELGTMFPYIRKAQELKWGIVIFNPNENYGIISKDGKVKEDCIPGSESPQRHCLYVWDKFVSNAKAEKILIVAHSYGGICTAYMLDRFVDDFYKRVKGIALTDSVHSSGMIPERSKQWFSKKALNWIKSSSPTDEPIPEANHFYGCRCFSAGHPKHEYTSGYAIESVFEFLKFHAKEKHNKGDDKVTNQRNETSEQSSVANNNKVDKDSIVVESLNEETKPQTQNGSNSITHEKDLQPNSTKTDESPETTNKASSENDTKVTVPMEIEASSEVDKDSTVAESLNEETKPQTQNDSNTITHEKDTTTTEDPQPNSTETDESPGTTNEASSENVTVPMEIDKATNEVSSENDNKVTEPMETDESLETTNEASPENDNKVTKPMETDESLETTNEASSENDNKVTKPMETDESLETTNEASSENDNKVTKPMETDKSLETINEASLENDDKVTEPMDIDKLPETTKTTSLEDDSNATGEPQLSSGLATVTNKLVVDELPIATNGINSEKDTIDIGEHQPDSGSATKTSDENAAMKETTVINKPTNEINLEKDTEKDILKAEMNVVLSNTEEETFMNDKESHEVVKNNLENEKIVNNIPEEITVDSNTDAQTLKNDNNSKDSSQDNNV